MCISYSPLFCYCIGYTSDNDWSTSVIPLDQYQDQLRRRILSDWEKLGIEKQLQIFQDRLQLQREGEFYQEQLQREIKEKEQIQQDRDKEQQLLLQEKATLTQQLDDATTLLQQAEKDKSSLELGTIVLYCCLCVHCLHYNTYYTMLSMEIISCTQYRSNCPCIRNNEIHVE